MVLAVPPAPGNMVGEGDLEGFFIHTVYSWKAPTNRIRRGYWSTDEIH